MEPFSISFRWNGLDTWAFISSSVSFFFSTDSSLFSFSGKWGRTLLLWSALQFHYLNLSSHSPPQHQRCCKLFPPVIWHLYDFPARWITLIGQSFADCVCKSPPSEGWDEAAKFSLTLDTESIRSTSPFSFSSRDSDLQFNLHGFMKMESYFGYLPSDLSVYSLRQVVDCDS